MATEGPYLAHTQSTAGVNLSPTAGLAGPNGSGQFLAVKETASRVVGLANSGGEAIAGILQNDPLAGQAANIAFVGVSKAVAGAAVTAGALLMTDTSARLITATSTNVAVAKAIESAAGANAVFTVLIIGNGKQ